MKLTVLALGLSYGWLSHPALSSSDLKTYGNVGEALQLISDEGLRRCSYKDTKGYWTIGIGHRIKRNIGCITRSEMHALFMQDLAEHTKGVNQDYAWATGEVKLVLINMSFQLGRRGLSEFVDALHYLENKQYSKAAEAMLDSKWYREDTPNRAMRLAMRIKALE